MTPQSLPMLIEEVRSKCTLPRKLYPDVPEEIAQQALSHFRDLFEVRNASVIPRMNELFVFWSEATDGIKNISDNSLGLERMRGILGLDASVQPGRLLDLTCQALEKSKPAEKKEDSEVPESN